MSLTDNELPLTAGRLIAKIGALYVSVPLYQPTETKFPARWRKRLMGGALMGSNEKGRI
jgi:hypothetical protein